MANASGLHCYDLCGLNVALPGRISKSNGRSELGIGQAIGSGMHNDQRIISKLVDAICLIPHAQGVVLGGSRGQNYGTDSSDYDFAIYYDDPFPLTNELIFENLTVAFEDVRPTRSGDRLCGKIFGSNFELYYRSLAELERKLLDANRGNFSLLPEQYFPQGSRSLDPISFVVNYPILWDRTGRLAKLKSSALSMPIKLRKSLLKFSFDGAVAAMANVKKVTQIEKQNYYLMSHCSLFIWYIHIAIFAANNMYPTMNRASSQTLETLKFRPPNLIACESEIFKLALGANLNGCLTVMRRLLDEVLSIVDNPLSWQ